MGCLADLYLVAYCLSVDEQPFMKKVKKVLKVRFSFNTPESREAQTSNSWNILASFFLLSHHHIRFRPDFQGIYDGAILRPLDVLTRCRCKMLRWSIVLRQRQSQKEQEIILNASMTQHIALRWLQLRKWSRCWQSFFPIQYSGSFFAPALFCLL